MKVGLSFAAGASLNKQAFPQDLIKSKRIAVSRTSMKQLVAIPTTCLQCPACCGIIAYLNGERLVQILGNPDHPNNKGGICAKGIGGINLVNDPERLLYPLKRMGPRGSNKWTTITWDEAYFILASRIRLLIKERRTDELVLDIGQSDPLLKRFIHAIGEASVIDRPKGKDLNRSLAFAAMTGHSALIPDLGKSRFILNFGANPYANHEYYIGLANRIIQARLERGAKLITFDVRMSETAAKSDEWHPPKSGTDGSVALAMAQVIVSRRMFDQKFLAQKTRISLASLTDHLSPYTPVWAESVSGIKAEDIERLAVDFIRQKPSVAIIGGGATDHENGYQNTQCISLLNWLSGNLEKEGGLFFPRFHSVLEPISSSEKESSSASGGAIQTVAELRDLGISIDTYFSYEANPAYTDPGCEQSSRLLKDENFIPFLAVMDTHMTETALLADLVLPSATYLEGWGVHPAPSLDGTAVLNLRQPAVSLLSPAEALRSPTFEAGKLLESSFRPRGEALEAGNFCLRLAEKIGGDLRKNLPFEDTLDFVKKMIAASTDSKTDISFLKQTGIWINNREKVQSDPKSEGNAEKILVRIDSSLLPDYAAVSSTNDEKLDRFILTPFKTNLGTKGMENSKWAREILHESRLWMNKERARQLGLKNGDKVRVSSSLGSINTRVLMTDRIHPDSVALAEGLGHSAFGNVAQAQKFRSKDSDTHLIWWGNKGKGVNPYAIVEPRVDPVGGGQASKDTVVQVQRLED